MPENLSEVYGGVLGLSRESIREQMRRSLEALGRESVDIFYLHKPDPGTPFEEQLQTCDELHEEGKFKELGLSNFAAWQVVQICEFCARKGLVAPYVFNW